MSTGAEGLIREVGQNAYRSVAKSERVEFGELVPVAADDANSPGALANPARVAGYPMRGGLRALDAQTAREVSEIFADWGNYVPDRLSRCAFERLIGFRFVRGDERVDIALTGPCWLAMWTFQSDGQVRDWSSPFHRDRASSLFARLGVPL